jgi:hypothetical protein
MSILGLMVSMVVFQSSGWCGDGSCDRFSSAVRCPDLNDCGALSGKLSKKIDASRIRVQNRCFGRDEKKIFDGQAGGLSFAVILSTRTR